MSKVAVIILLLVAAQGLWASDAPYAQISNMSLDVWVEDGDWEYVDPYPCWWELAGSPYWISDINPVPTVGAVPYITGGGDNGGSWANFYNATAPGSVRGGWVLGIYYVSRFRASFDYAVYRLPSELQLQVWVRRARDDILVWNSTLPYQSGHFAIERDVELDPFSYVQVALAPPVPEPASLLTLGFAVTSAGVCAFRRRRRC